MDHPKKSEYNSSVQPRMKTARISRNQGGAGFQPATGVWTFASRLAERDHDAIQGSAARTPPLQKGGFQPATDRQDACPTFQSRFDLGADGGLTRRSFLGVSVFAAFLSGCLTAGRNHAVGKSAAKAEARIAELKLALPAPTEPSATLRPAVTVGNLIFVSGHISRAADGKLITGRVGEDLDVAAGKAAARQCGLAILSTLRNELGSLDRVKRVVKVLGMVNCPAGFRDQPTVINGCSELFLDVFGKENGLGARSAVGMSSLPSGVAVEIEAIFEIE